MFATYYTKITRIPGVTFYPANVQNRNWIKRLIHNTVPDVLIYAAGNNRVEFADVNPRITEQMHTIGPTTLAASTDIFQPKFIFLSNPYVFDGSKGNYHENDIILPTNILGRMKVGGENAVRSKCLNHIILRASPIFGRSTGNHFSFFDQLRMSFDRGKRMEVRADQLHSFGSIAGLCDLVARLINSGIRNRILHYGGLTKSTYFDFARTFAQHFKYDPNLVVPKIAPLHKVSNQTELTIQDFSLNCSQAAELLKIKPLLLEESFDLIQQQLISGF